MWGTGRDLAVGFTSRARDGHDVPLLPRGRAGGLGTSEWDVVVSRQHQPTRWTCPAGASTPAEMQQRHPHQTGQQNAVTAPTRTS